ncbi:MAG TPA: hypothetical protein VKU40_14640 [Thermoanaerobaculia bacterium]|nr:hypothetical protein [Thermoanaerobaculia bacterium]
MPSVLHPEPHLDAVIAGGGPAGAATAIHLARAARWAVAPRRRPTYLHPPATAHHEPHGHGTDPMGSTA